MQNIKTATTIDEQITKLTSRGIVIEDKEKAKENLLDIGYFRLGFYCFPFELSYPEKKNRTHEYIAGTKIEDVVRLYYFDVDLRNLFSKYIYRIEINFKTFLIYTVSNHYKNSPTWFIDPNVVSKKFIANFDVEVYDKLLKKNSVIKSHHKCYINDKYAPAWKTIEFMTFGNTLVLYQSIKDVQLKLKISKQYGFSSVNTFVSYLDTIRELRNACAHNGVLFDNRLSLSIKDGPAGKLEENKNKLKGAYLVLKYLLTKISPNRAIDLENNMNDILRKCPDNVQNIILNCSGFKNIL